MSAGAGPAAGGDVAASETASRGPGRMLVILLVGLLVGVALGLYVGWVAWPTEFTDAGPAILETNYRYDYTLMTAEAYAVDGDLAAAQARLATLADGSGYDWYLAMTLDAIVAGKPAADLRYLVNLAQALGVTAPALTPYLPAGAEGGG